MSHVLNLTPGFVSDNGYTEPEAEEILSENEVQETETPTEATAEETPATEEQSEVTDDSNEQPAPSVVENLQERVDANELVVQKQVQGLLSERAKLLKEISELRGQKREIRQQDLIKVENKIDELNDVHPEDLKVIEKVMRAKGYITREEASRMNYEQTKNDELGKFLERYPEYKPENDRDDINWNALQRELQYYRMPEDPRRVGEILERAHRAIAKPVSDRAISTKKQQLKTAGVGGGAGQRSSSPQKPTANTGDLPHNWEQIYRDGGWSEEEIQEIKNNL